MKLTRFTRLEYAVGLVSGHAGVSQLAKQLTGGGEHIDPSSLVIGTNGIYLLAPGGSLTQVLLYRVDNDIESPSLSPIFERDAHHGGFNTASVVSALHPYHLVECPVLAQQVLYNWPGEYAVSQQPMGELLVNFTRGADTVLEISDQRVAPCEACLQRLREAGGQYANISSDNFKLSRFLGQAFEQVPLGSTGSGVNCRAVPSTLRADWGCIENTLLMLNGFQCQGEHCQHRDFSAPDDQQLLQAHYVHSDPGYGHFARLRALCVACHMQQPGHGYLRNRVPYHRYKKRFGVH